MCTGMRDQRDRAAFTVATSQLDDTNPDILDVDFVSACPGGAVVDALSHLDSGALPLHVKFQVGSA